MSEVLWRIRQRIVNRPLLIEPAAFAGLLDGLGERLGIESAAGLPAPEMRTKRRYGSEGSKARHVAVITVSGELAHKIGGGMDADSGVATYQTISDAVVEAATDDEVAGIVLRIDSPGGEATESAWQAARDIREAAQMKPVAAVADELAASAAYLLASQATRLFVPDLGRVGSVGVIMTHVDRSEQVKRAGLKPTVITMGAKKDMFSSLKPLSKEAEAEIRAELGAIYERFVGAVADGRGGRISADAIRATEAGVFRGAEAVRMGLADEVGGFAAALAWLEDELGAGDQGPGTSGAMVSLSLGSGGLVVDWGKVAAALTPAEYDLEPVEKVQGSRFKVQGADLVPGLLNLEPELAVEEQDVMAEQVDLAALKAERDGVVLSAIRQYGLGADFANAIEDAGVAADQIGAIAQSYVAAGKPEYGVALIKKDMRAADYSAALLERMADDDKADGEFAAGGAVLAHEGASGAEVKRRSMVDRVRAEYPDYKPNIGVLAAIERLAMDTRGAI